IKVVVHDFKVYKYKDPLPIVPDYWCRKLEIDQPENNPWINYNSHELVGLTKEELEKNFYTPYPELRKVLEPIFADK
ncbi:MAG: phosphoribosyltransferase, partial [Treponema sp.]|nr:phosphoribosyltransferase [Treponema sp.]